MANKDAYWFRHDSNARNDLKLLKIKRIYTHWGIGIYWEVIEILREQTEYKYPIKESDLQFLCEELLRCHDFEKFKNWLNDCFSFELFYKDEAFFFSDSLIHRMKKWEHTKANGKQGGRGNKKQIESKSKANRKLNKNLPESGSKADRKHNIIKDNIRRDNMIEEKEFTPPTIEEVKSYCRERGYSESVGETAWHYYHNMGWIDKDGDPVKVWKNKLNNVWFKDVKKNNDRPMVY